MKTTFVKMDYDKVMAKPRLARKAPGKPNLFWRCLIRFLSIFGMMGTKFRYETEGFEKIGKDQPCLILMNHSSFLDMQIIYRIFFPKYISLVCSSDAFVGLHGLMEWVMRSIGAFPTQKFVSDLRLVQDMDYCFKKLKSNVVMFPETCYSFDGTATTLPQKMGILLKKFGVPVIMVETFGAFSRNPLYNELQIRKKVPVTAKAYVLYTPEEIREKSVKELSEGVEKAFGFDHYRWQQENNVVIDEPFRADGLHRVLYKCAHCGAEGRMLGKGTGVTCSACGKRYELTPLGKLEASDGVTEIDHIPDYYRWEREQVRQEILDQQYHMSCDVDIVMITDNKFFYSVGQGHLTHDTTGFTLTGCDGRLNYRQLPQVSYGLFVDFYWYETGDIVSIGDTEVHYFCFPKNGEPVAKMRLATEEMYKLYKAKKLTVPKE